MKYLNVIATLLKNGAKPITNEQVKASRVYQSGSNVDEIKAVLLMTGQNKFGLGDFRKIPENSLFTDSSKRLRREVIDGLNEFMGTMAEQRATKNQGK